MVRRRVFAGCCLAGALLLVACWRAIAWQPAPTADRRLSAVIEALRAGDRSARASAARQLGEWGARGAPAVPALIKALGDSEIEVRDAAVGALGGIGPAAVSPLVAALAHRQTAVRVSAAAAIAQLAPRENVDVTPAVPALLILLSDAAAQARASAAYALGEVRSRPPAAVPALRRALNDSDVSVKINAARALAQYFAEPEAVRDTLMPLLRDQFPHVRSDAALVLGQLGVAAAPVTSELVRAAKSDTDQGVRRAAMNALQALARKEPGLQGVLIELLTHDDQQVRALAVAGLREVQRLEPSTVAAVVRVAAADAAPTVRAWAVEVLGQARPPSAAVIRTLCERLRDPDKEVRGRAAEALQNLGEVAAAAARPLTEQLQQEANAGVRAQIAGALGRLGPAARDSVPALAKLLDDPNGNVRLAALIALGHLGATAEAAAPALSRSLRDAADAERRYAADALRKIGGAATADAESAPLQPQPPPPAAATEPIRLPQKIQAADLPNLIRLKRDDFDRREAVVQRLGEQGTDVAQALVNLAEDRSAPLRLPALYMIRRCFWNLARGLLRELDAADPAEAARVETVLAALIARYPLEAHHHGGDHQAAVVFEMLDRPDRALAAYTRWVPAGSFCGTCAAEIGAEKTLGLVRCHVRLKQGAQAEDLCWAAVVRRENRIAEGGAARTLAMTLVESYAARGQLSELERRARRAPDQDNRLREIILEAVRILQDFERGSYEPHIARLDHHLNPLYFNLSADSDRDWRARLVADALGRQGDKALPLLLEHLKDGGFHGWTLYALHRVGSPAVVAPLVHEAAAEEEPLDIPVVLDLLRSFPQEATRQVLPLLDHEVADVRYAAGNVLAALGTADAVPAVIERIGRHPKALWILWCLTGELLEADRLPADAAQRRWRDWWQQQAARFESRSAAWWASAAAVPALARGLGSRDATIQATAAARLAQLEHPILADLIRHRNDSVRATAVNAWSHFEPRACVPMMVAEPELYHERLIHLTRQNLPRDAQAWSAWWADHQETADLELRDRWWSSP
jgi:HEAT repeat protein